MFFFFNVDLHQRDADDTGGELVTSCLFFIEKLKWCPEVMLPNSRVPRVRGKIQLQEDAETPRKELLYKMSCIIC